MTLTSTDYEHSVTVERENGERVDFCVFKLEKKFTVGISAADGEHLASVMLSPEEAKILLDHLLDARTQSALS